MDKELVITFVKEAEQCSRTFAVGEWDEYSYSEDFLVVFKDKERIAAYKMPLVFSIELI